MSLRAQELNSDIYTWDYFQNDDICRLCWSRNAHKVIILKSPANGTTIKNLLAEKIEDCLNLDLSSEGAPEKVCSKCCDIIDSFYDFKLFCYEADRKLNEILMNHTLETSDHLPEDSLNVELEKHENYSDVSSDDPGEDSFQDYLNLSLLKVEKQEIKKSTANCVNKKYDFSSTDSSNDNTKNSLREYLDLPSNGGEQNQEIKKEIKEEHCELEVKYSGSDISNANLQDSLQQYLNSAPLIRKQAKKGKKNGPVRKSLKKESKDKNKKDSLREQLNKTPMLKDQIQKTKKITNPMPNFCYICRTDCKNTNKLTIHYFECHGIENGQYKCFGCDKRFSNGKNRLGHELDFCKGMKDGYKCCICGRYLPKRRTYEYHMKAHRANKPVNLPRELFKCGKCYKKFVTKDDLTEHKKSHEIKEDYVCETCGRCFSRRDYLTKHILTHQGVKRHACPHCDYKAIQKSSLLVHLRRHTEQRPFSCDLCPQQCVSSSNLRAHRQRHLGLKQFQCTICSKSFGYKQSLEEHVAATHERVVQSHTCPHCGAIFSRGRGLRRHIETRHGKTKEKLLSKTDGADGEELVLNGKM